MQLWERWEVQKQQFWPDSLPSTILFHETLFNWSNQMCQPLKYKFIFNVNKYSINLKQRELLSLKISNVHDIFNNQLLLKAIK